MDHSSIISSEKTSIWGAIVSSALTAVLIYIGTKNVFICLAVFVFSTVLLSVLDGIYCRLRDLLLSKN